MLPSELQWQRAAQGDDSRQYPWGDFFDAQRCNTRESWIGETTPVDQYDNGMGPYGVCDASGNVWEWCLNAYHLIENTGLGQNMPRAVRGGSWMHPKNEARLTYRDFGAPDTQLAYLGFRIALFD
jgi:formylglycine-generating enzyme required for sulfatase activity